MPEDLNSNQDTGHLDVHLKSNHAKDNTESQSRESGHSKGKSIQISKYTKALITKWNSDVHKGNISPNRISVSQSVSFLAFLYEKMRNAVEFREDHLIRKAAIERIIRRRLLLNENARNVAEPLIKELLWARYYENNTIAEGKIKEVQTSIDKYFFLKNEISAGRSGKEREKIETFMIEVLSCEIEEILSHDPKREAFNNFIYQLLRNHIEPFNDSTMERDIQVYIAVERSFAHSDDALIRYHLLKLMMPDIVKITWKNSDEVMSEIYDVYTDIEKSLVHPLRDKVRTFVNKQAPPFYILRDIFNLHSSDIENIFTDEDKLKSRVDEACRKRYEETKSRLRRTGIRSFIYIMLTKVIFALILEIPYDLYVMGSLSYIPIIINVVFPPILMTIIILSVTIPGDENTKKIFSLIRDILVENPDDPELVNSTITIGKIYRKQSPIFSAVFSLFYLLTYLISFGSIVLILSKMNFNPASQLIFIFFVTLVTFFAFRVINITREYLVIDRDNPLTPLIDFFFLPIIRVGQWLSGEVLTKFNVIMFFLDFIIEMPLKGLIEIIDEWAHFVRLKKEEMV